MFNFLFQFHQLLECRSQATNNYDQFCINYINEKFQQEFVERMLIRDKKWYDKEMVDVKFIDFFDNSAIVGRQNDKNYNFW